MIKSPRMDSMRRSRRWAVLTGSLAAVGLIGVATYLALKATRGAPNVRNAPVPNQTTSAERAAAQAPSSTSSSSWKGDDSAIAVPKAVTVETADQWKALWIKHTAGQAQAPVAPDVDFSRYNVVAVFAGNLPAGSRVDITHLRFGRDAIRVEYHVSAAASTGGVSRPFEFRLIPKLGMPVIFYQG